MPWGRVDDSHYDHDKVLALPVAVRNEAVGLYWRAISYSNAKLTDGVVSDVIVTHLDGRPEVVAALVAARLWHRRAGGRTYRIHDFADFNPTRAEVQANRDRKVEAGRLGGLRSGETRRKTNGKQGGSKPEAGASGVLELPTRPDPTDSDTPQPPASQGARRNGSNPRSLGLAPRQQLSPRAAAIDSGMLSDDDELPADDSAWSA